jgi:hypothetical protein
MERGDERPGSFPEADGGGAGRSGVVGDGAQSEAPAGRRDQHQAGYQVGPIQGHPRRHRTTHRVASQDDRGPSPAFQKAGHLARHQVEGIGAVGLLAAAEPREVEGDDPISGGKGVDHPPPGQQVLSVAMQQDDRGVPGAGAQGANPDLAGLEDFRPVWRSRLALPVGQDECAHEQQAGSEPAGPVHPTATGARGSARS